MTNQNAGTRVVQAALATLLVVILIFFWLAAQTWLAINFNIIFMALIFFATELLKVVIASAPNVSLATLPVGYYGASWIHKTDAQIGMLAKQRVVILMQDDGVCHARCCPHSHGANCGNPPEFNASTLPGCNPSCDQKATQDAVFTRIKAAAREGGIPEPHTMLYVNNSVY